MPENQNTYDAPEPGALIFLSAIILSAAVSFTLNSYLLEFPSPWPTIIIAALAGIFGLSVGENIGDAIIFTLFLSVLVFIFIKVIPFSVTVRMTILSIATGICVGKLVYATWKELI